MSDIWTQKPGFLFRRIVKVYFIFSTFLFLTYLILERETTNCDGAKNVNLNKDEANSNDYIVFTSQYKRAVQRNDSEPGSGDKNIDIETDSTEDEHLESDIDNIMVTLDEGALEEESDSLSNRAEDEGIPDEGKAEMRAEINVAKEKKRALQAKWKNMIKEQAELYDHTVVKIVKGVQMSYLTAIATNSTPNGTAWDKIIINGWERKKHASTKLFCCFKSGNLTGVTLVKNRPQWNTPKIKLVVAIQFVCDNPWKDTKTFFPEIVGLSTSTTCNDVQYVDVEFAIKPKEADSVAFCGKIIYGSYPADRIIEWMEMNKVMGVSHVALFTYNVTKQAMAVLKHYQKTGYLTLKEFDFPLKSVFPRYIGQKYLLAWVDEQVTVFDCIQRFRGYKYIGILDVDEFLVPKSPDIKDYPTMMSRFLRKYPNAAGFTFQTELFILSWAATNPGSQLVISQYRNRTKPLWDRRKSILVTDRVHPQSVWTHGFNGVHPHKRIHLFAGSASVFHYRSCRPQWLTQGTCLKNAKRITDRTMTRYIPHIEAQVLNISRRLLT